jgi:hypothetical protein
MSITGNYGMIEWGFGSLNSFQNNHPDAPLMYALGFALDHNHGTDHFLRGIFPPFSVGLPGGGDPGWVWYHNFNSVGDDVIVVEVDSTMAPPDGIWNEYNMEKIRYEVRVALGNFVYISPFHLNEVDLVIRKYDLLSVVAPTGCLKVSDWICEVPKKRIINLTK